MSMEKKQRMKPYNFFNSIQFKELVKPRKFDLKVGEHMDYCTADNWKEKLSSSKYKFVLIGIEEDLGVRENGGYPGTKNTWLPSLKCLLNTQRNEYNNLDSALIFGSLKFEEETSVKEIDQVVSDLVQLTIQNSKIPIILGGGHNNAYGAIKGVSSGLKQPINVINIDAHTDFRDMGKRHSGNGFSYAYNEGFLKKYAVLGLDTLYTPDYIYREFNTNSDLLFINKQDIDSKKYSLSEALDICKDHLLSDTFTGLEIDLDVIKGVHSSAMSPSGLDFSKLRESLRSSKLYRHIRYLHICEGIIPESSQGFVENQTPKIISYLISDFINMAISPEKV